MPQSQAARLCPFEEWGRRGPGRAAWLPAQCSLLQAPNRGTRRATGQERGPRPRGRYGCTRPWLSACRMEGGVGRGPGKQGSGLTWNSSSSSCRALFLSASSASSLLVAATCSSASSRCSRPWYLPGEELAPSPPQVLACPSLPLRQHPTFGAGPPVPAEIPGAPEPPVPAHSADAPAGPPAPGPAPWPSLAPEGRQRSLRARRADHHPHPGLRVRRPGFLSLLCRPGQISLTLWGSTPPSVKWEQGLVALESGYERAGDYKLGIISLREAPGPGVRGTRWANVFTSLSPWFLTCPVTAGFTLRSEATQAM